MTDWLLLLFGIETGAAGLSAALLILCQLVQLEAGL